MTDDEIEAAMNTAVDDHEQAKRRYAHLIAWGRRKHPELPPAVADMRTRSFKEMQDAMADYSLTQQEALMYASVLTARRQGAVATDLHEFLHPTYLAEDDLRDAKPTVTTPSAGFAINTGDKRRWPDA